MVGGSTLEKENEFRAHARGIPGLRWSLRHFVWDQHDLTLKFPKIDRDESVYVLVVGDSIVGLGLGYNHVTKGKSVMVLEPNTRGVFRFCFSNICYDYTFSIFVILQILLMGRKWPGYEDHDSYYDMVR
jgi:hypothetical protein